MLFQPALHQFIQLMLDILVLVPRLLPDAVQLLLYLAPHLLSVFAEPLLHPSIESAARLFQPLFQPLFQLLNQPGLDLLELAVRLPPYLVENLLPQQGQLIPDAATAVYLVTFCPPLSSFGR